MRERWFGATGRRVPEIAREGDFDLDDALVLDSVDDHTILRDAHERGRPIVVRVGRYGPFLEHGERRASLREDLAPDELTLDVALALLDQAAQSEQPLGYCPETSKPVFLKVGTSVAWNSRSPR